METHVNHSKSHAKDCENCANGIAKIDTFERKIVVTGNLDEKQIQKLLLIADKCPVHKTLHEEVSVNSDISLRT